jgi:hypothetical protein
MDIIKLLLERLLSWPVITLLVFLVFKKPLTIFLTRLNILKAGKEGFSLDASSVAVAIQAEAKVETGLSSEARERLKLVKDVAISRSIQQREQLIRADLRKMDLNVSHEAVDLLVRQLATMQATAAAEQIYRTIFGSQIKALKILNTQGGTAPRAKFAAVYDFVRSRSSPEVYGAYSLQQWLDVPTFTRFADYEG